MYFWLFYSIRTQLLSTFCLKCNSCCRVVYTFFQYPWNRKSETNTGLLFKTLKESNKNTLMTSIVGSLSNSVVVLGKGSKMSRLIQVTRHVILFTWFQSWYNNVFDSTFDENGRMSKFWMLEHLKPYFLSWVFDWSLIVMFKHGLLRVY